MENNIPANRLDAVHENLTYSALCTRLPVISKEKLPALKTVLTGVYDSDIFFSGAAADGMLTIYSAGFYLYQEQSSATVYSVSLAGSFMAADYTSLTGDSALESESIPNLPWFWPLVIAGKIRLERNRSKRCLKAEEHFIREQQNQKIFPVVPDFVAEAVEHSDEEERERILSDRLKTALGALTEREQQVIALYVRDGQDRNRVAQSLHIRPVTVSNTKRRGIVRLRENLFRQKAT